LQALAFEQHLQKEDCHAFILGLEQEKLAYGDYMLDREGEARLCRLIVNPYQRGKGYGKQLVKQLIDEVKQKEPGRKICLFVLEGNEAAIHCYKASGFSFDG